MKRCSLGPALMLVMLGIGSSTAIGATHDKTEKIQCTRLQSRMDEIRLRRRMGYTAKQGRISKQKLSALEAEYRARCR
jgi:hypothetical protein